MILLARRRKDIMDFPQAAERGFVDASALLLLANGAVVPNPGKRGRDSVSVPVAAAAQLQQSHPFNVSSLQPQPGSAQLLPPPQLVSLASLQSQPSLLVSTGLRLSLEQQHQQQSQMQSMSLLSSSSSSLLSSLLSDESAAPVNRQMDAIEQYLHAQGEQLRRALAEGRCRHYLTFLSAVNKSAALRLREKEADVLRAGERSTELEDHLARLRTESMAWQAKAMAGQAVATSLHAQLQQAVAAATAAAAQPPGKGGEPVEDAESAFVDPDRVESERKCRACRWRTASVVLLPCRHLCLCDACDGGGSGGPASTCPVCRCVRTGSVQVFLPYSSPSR